MKNSHVIWGGGAFNGGLGGGIAHVLHFVV